MYPESKQVEHWEVFVYSDWKIIFFCPSQFLGFISRLLTSSFPSLKPNTYIFLFSLACSLKASYLAAYCLKHSYIVIHIPMWPVISRTLPIIWAFAFILWYVINMFTLVISASLISVTQVRKSTVRKCDFGSMVSVFEIQSQAPLPIACSIKLASVLLPAIVLKCGVSS